MTSLSYMRYKGRRSTGPPCRASRDERSRIEESAMRWSLTIGRFGGTAVKIHVTFLLLLAWIGFSAWQQQGAAAARDSIVFIVLIFACVVLHEFGHILVGAPLRHRDPRSHPAADRRGGEHAERCPRSPRRSSPSRSPGRWSISSSPSSCCCSSAASAPPTSRGSTTPGFRFSRGSPRPTSFSPSSISSPPFRWTAAACCGRCWR